MSWTEAALPWLPIVPVIAMAGIALIEAAVLPHPGADRRGLMGGIVMLGALAIGATIWFDRIAATPIERSRADRLAALLPGQSADRPDQLVDAAATRVVALDKEVAGLRAKLRDLEERSQSRTVDPGTAAKVGDFLRPFGSRRVVVSCVKGDVEAFNYANQIANLLKGAGWDALGPETTELFGDAPAMGISLYVRAVQHLPDTVRVLQDAFAKFNIAYQSRIPPNPAIPDGETVELFIGPKPQVAESNATPASSVPNPAPQPGTGHPAATATIPSPPTSSVPAKP